MGRYLEGWTAANPGDCLNHSPQDNFEWTIHFLLACALVHGMSLLWEVSAGDWNWGKLNRAMKIRSQSLHFSSTNHFRPYFTFFHPKKHCFDHERHHFRREVSASLEDRFGRSPVATSARFDPWRVGGLRGRSGNGGLALCHWSLWRWCDPGDGKRALGNEFLMGKTVGISESATLKSPLTIQDAAFIQWGNNEGAHRHKHILAAFGKVVFIKCLRSDCASRARPLE